MDQLGTALQLEGGRGPSHLGHNAAIHLALAAVAPAVAFGIMAAHPMGKIRTPAPGRDRLMFDAQAA